MFKKILFLLIASSLFSSERDIKICLTMVTLNCDTVIRECLKSVADIVDYVFVYDLGSVDYTPAVVDEFIQKNWIYGKVVQKTQEKGDPLTRAVKSAQKAIIEWEGSLANTYLLVMQPDMVLNIGQNFKTEELTKDAYLILQKFPQLGCSVYLPNLLRASRSWENKGHIFSPWESKDPIQIEKMHHLFLEGGDSDLEQKLDALLLASQKEIGNGEITLILAQTYKGLKKFKEAIPLYKSCIENAKRQEEIWFSKMMLGSCYEEMEDWKEALYWYLEAYQTDPDRADSLRKIATYYRFKGKNDLAYMFARHGSLILPTSERTLFDYPPLRDYHFDEEMSVTAYYTKFRSDGLRASSDLMLRKNVPYWIREQNGRNMLFYVQNLANARFMPIPTDLPLIQEGSDEHYHPMNPSILKTDKGYKLIFRGVNYTQTGAKIFKTIDPDGVFRNRNFLLTLTSDFQIVSDQEILEDLNRERHYFPWLQGIEDCRQVLLDGSLWFTCTTSDTNPTGNKQISLCHLEEGKSRTLQIDKLTPLLGPDINRCEKNWLPFIDPQGKLKLIYSYDPFVIFSPDFDTGECDAAYIDQPEYDFTSFRGSAAPIPFDNGYLMIIHEVVHYPDFSRCYLHRFVSLDSQFVIQKVSKPFVFQHQGVEFCLSMTIDHAGKDLIIPIGIEDREIYLTFVDLDTVRSLLQPLPTTNEM